MSKASHVDTISHADSEIIPDVCRDQANPADIAKLGDPNLDILERADVALDIIRQVKEHNRAIGLVPPDDTHTDDTDADDDTPPDDEEPTPNTYRQRQRINDHNRELEIIREKWNGDLNPRTCSYSEWEDFHGFKDGENYPFTPEAKAGILYLLEKTADHIKSGKVLDTGHVGLLLHLIKSTAISDPRIPPWAGYWTHGPVDEIECAQLLGYDLDHMNEKIQEIIPDLTIVDDSISQGRSEPTLLHGPWAESRTNGHAVLELALNDNKPATPDRSHTTTAAEEWIVDHEGQAEWYEKQGLTEDDSVRLSPVTRQAMANYFRRAADALDAGSLSTISEVAVITWGIRALIVADPKIPNDAWKWTAGPLLEYDESMLLGCIPDEMVQRIWSVLSNDLSFVRMESDARPCTNEARKHDFDEYRRNGRNLRKCLR